MFKHLNVSGVSYFACHAVLLFFFAWVNSGWGSSFSRVARWAGGEREGPYPRGGVGYLWLARPSRLAARAPPESARGLGQIVLSALANFLRKNGTILGGPLRLKSIRFLTGL
jgi:hypothetical protein